MSTQQANIEAYARRLMNNRDEIAGTQMRAISAAIPELVDRDLAGLAHLAAKANLESFAGMLENGQTSDFSAPPAVCTLVRRLAWAGIEVDMLARAYRIGAEWLYEDVRSYCHAACTDVGEAIALLGELGHQAMRFSDLSTTQVIQQYHRERDELGRSALTKRADTVRVILEGRTVDLATFEQRLGYGFAGNHTGLRMCAPSPARGDTLARLREVVAELVAAADGAAALVIQDRPDSLMTWLPSSLDANRIEAAAAPLCAETGILVAIGNPAVGVEGFRQTYRQAERASLVGPPNGGQLVWYSDVSLEALLLEDPEAAQAFVAEELGELSGAGETNRALRDTLSAFLDNQCSHVPTARAMYLHRNTVAERIRRIESVLGLAVTDRSVELAAALRLHRHFTAAQPPESAKTSKS